MDEYNRQSTDKLKGICFPSAKVEPDMSNITFDNRVIDLSSNEPAPCVDYQSNEDQLLVELRNKLKAEHIELRITNCGSGYVDEGIGDEYKQWRSEAPVLISAQTGTGKNTFIEDVLLAHVTQINKDSNIDNKVLLLSNRIALRKQVKQRLENETAAVVYSYHQFLEAKIKPEEYTHIVCDECHFFTSDARFNSQTGLILDKIRDNFQNAIRIYMSSTFCDCLHYIVRMEKEIFDKRSEKDHEKFYSCEPIDDYPRSFVYYKYDRDYSYLRIRHFHEYSELHKRVVESANAKQKWLIFIDSKNECQKLADKLADTSLGTIDREEDIYVIDASSKNEREYEDFIANEKFEQKILISTSVIDNGINFKDPKLLNIIVSDISKDKILQMLGRKRRESRDEIVNLYIKAPTRNEVERQLEYLENHSNAYHLHDLAYDYDPDNTQTDRHPYEELKARMDFNAKYYNGKEHDFKGAIHWFYRDEENPEYVKQNRLARSYVRDVLIPRYKFVLQRMEETESNQEFITHQLSWFGKGYDEISFVAIEDKAVKERDKKAKNEFLEYVNGLAGRIISKDEKDSFGVEFFQRYHAVFGFRAEDNESRINKAIKKDGKYGYGKDVINKIFTALDISLEIMENGSSWIINSIK